MMPFWLLLDSSRGGVFVCLFYRYRDLYCVFNISLDLKGASVHSEAVIRSLQSGVISKLVAFSLK